jgi:superfamily II DNA helicase RecQ
VGVLKDCEVEDSTPIWKKNFSKKKTNEDRSKERKESIETAFSGVQENGKCRISELAEYLGKVKRQCVHKRAWWFLDRWRRMRLKEVRERKEKVEKIYFETERKKSSKCKENIGVFP